MNTTSILEEIGNDFPCRALLLCPADSPIVPIVARTHLVTTTMDRLDQWPELGAYEWLVSYGYRYLVSPEVLRVFEGRALNLHISLLPWNRGVDPNLWSWVDGTPKGVTIHQLDAGVDTGPVLAQERVELDDSHTLRSSYAELQRRIVALFGELWPRLVSGERVARHPQTQVGSYHRTVDRARVQHLLTQGWDTPVAVFEDWAAEAQLSRECWA